MAAGFVGSTKNFPFSFDVDVEEEEPGRSTPHLSKRIVPIHTTAGNCYHLRQNGENQKGTKYYGLIANPFTEVSRVSP
ncbi:hypothetical protein RR48_13894 [Papilio machaon]|uniref:Uncharacterized protein n=1 Tax=Papilio machaon TaxID=76193 RepID=A0A194RGU2_PAPMA|nr:hypothetical protein RR48_13894 [Papilio machaon]